MGGVVSDTHDQHKFRYWDSCAFIALIAAEAGRVDDCRKLLDDAISGKYLLVTSRVSVAEVTRVDGLPVLGQHQKVIERFFDNDYMLIVDTDRKVAETARQLIWDYPTLKPLDAIHLASAERAGCTLLYTYDGPLKKLNGVHPLIEITDPIWRGQLALEGVQVPQLAPTVMRRPRRSVPAV